MSRVGFGRVPRTAFVSKSRDLASGLGEARRAWLVFLGACKAQGHLAAGGRWPFEDDTRSFKNLNARLTTGFPIKRGAAVEVAEAARRIARALADCADPADREELGGLLLAAVAFLDRLLHEDAVDAAALSRRMAGEPPDDLGD